MSEPESTPPVPSGTPEPAASEPIAPEQVAQAGTASPAHPPPPSRLRRFFLRHLPLTFAGAAVLFSVSIAGLYFSATSARFENFVRKEMVRKLETATGGRVEIAAFHWHLLSLEAEADGLVIHGREAPGEAPYAQAGRLRVQLSVLGFWSPRIRLRDLEIFWPQLHLIVYPDGSTNQPQPRKPRKPGKPAIDSFFDLQASRVIVEEGVLDYENRAAAFDFQDRHIPLDFAANDLFLRMVYIPGAPSLRGSSGAREEDEESYRIEAGVRDLNLSRGASSYSGKARYSSIHGFLQASLELRRTAVTLSFLRITARSRGVKDRTLQISGSLDDFAHPRWQARAVGELDMRLLDPVTGYPFAPEGIAHLDLAGAGQAGAFRADGSIHVEDGTYIGTGVVATGVGLDAYIHADPEQLLITSIAARLRQGGQIDGDLSLSHWLPALPGAASLRPASAKAGKSRGARGQLTRPVRPPPAADVITLPVDGKVTAHFKDVALDTLLEMVADPPFQHLGFDTRLNGPATATWIKGDQHTLSVNALLSLDPPAQAAPQKVAASGLIDATYTQSDGAVDLRKLELHLPSSQVEARGHLGAYPLSSSSALAVDFHSRKLEEFDTLLRDLGLTCKEKSGGSGSRSSPPGCKSGAAGLPVALSGQADFHGAWTGSLIDPGLSGNLKATQLAIELPASSTANFGQPKSVRLDSVEATGSYSAARIEISQGLLHRGNAEISLSGSLAAAAGSAVHGRTDIPSFDANSLLHLRLRGGKVDVNDLRPFLARDLPVTGSLDAQLQIDGAIHALGGSGWVELDNGSIYSEPVARIGAQGSIANQTIKLTSLTVSEDAGKIAATGSYDLQSHRFQLDAKGMGIDVARIETLRRKSLAVTGKLEFSVQGSGTIYDPRLEARAILSGLTLGGESLGGLKLEAHTANRAVTYALTTQLESAALAVHGQTALNGDYATQAKLDFSHFNIGALFKLANMQGISGESALAGTATLEGLLARPDDLHGEALLDQLAVTVSGVHLKSEGSVHATLANARIDLDRLHVTGEDTDLRVQGSLSLKGKQQLDMAASGAINLKLAETLDPDLTAGGNATFQVEAHGPLKDPGLRGRINFQDGSLALEDLTNGLSQIHGSLEFNQNRLEVKSLTAMSGGGLLSVAGYLAYQQGLYADLTATGNGIRIRYPQGVSSLADASLHLQGPRNNLLLSGDVLITRFTINPDLDIAALTAQTNTIESVAPPDAPSNHLRLDVKITSSPQLNFQNAYAKLAGNIDLRLRGTVASPSLLGRVSITEGSGIIAGTHYELQSGEISFTNPVRIEPSIDLVATSRVEDYDITLGLHGAMEKPAINYRSDPPLPESDVVALLAQGRTGDQQRLYTQQQQQLAVGSNPTTDSLLGGALNATVSNRVQKLFGAGSVKVDPNYLGVLGNSTTRIIVEEQLGSNVILTYATDVDTTAQQLIQAEVAINRHLSLVVARDESGVFSVVVKATRRYR